MYSNTMIKYVLKNLYFLWLFGIPVIVFSIGYLIQYFGLGNSDSIFMLKILLGSYSGILVLASIINAIKFNKMEEHTKERVKENLMDYNPWILKLFK